MHALRTYRRPSVSKVPIANVRTPDWKSHLDRAVRETDIGKLTARVQAAEAAIFIRWQEVGEVGRGGAEWQAMHAATDELLSLRVYKLKWPDFRLNS